MADKWYKLLDETGHACNGGHGLWNLPTKNDDADGTYTPGEWMPKIDKVTLCYRGYHLMPIEEIFQWSGNALFEAEIAEGATVDRIGLEGKIAVSQARLTRHIEAWNASSQRLLACEFAERALPIWEKVHPEDTRVRRCIEVARLYAKGESNVRRMKYARCRAMEASSSSSSSSSSDSSYSYMTRAVRCALAAVYKTTLVSCSIDSVALPAADAIGSAARSACVEALGDTPELPGGFYAPCNAEHNAFDLERRWQLDQLRKLIA